MKKDSIDEMVRDFTSVVPRAKSEVRQRLIDYCKKNKPMKKEPDKEIERIVEEFVKRFANPTAKYLGNDFADYPKANIKDATGFLRITFISYRNTILQRDAYKKQFSDAEIEAELLPEKRLEAMLANNWYQKGRDDEYYSFLTPQ